MFCGIHAGGFQCHLCQFSDDAGEAERWRRWLSGGRTPRACRFFVSLRQIASQETLVDLCSALLDLETQGASGAELAITGKRTRFLRTVGRRV